MILNVFFYGPYNNPGGPNEVNRNIAKCIKNEVRIKTHYNKIIGRLENVYKILVSDVIVFSGLMFHSYELNLAKIFGKKIIYIMHGCAKIETGKGNPLENKILEKSDLILCVSNTYRSIIAKFFPEYKDKLNVLFNGINWEESDEIIKSITSNIKHDSNRIILFGGGRTVKKNIIICQAVQRLNVEAGTKLHVDVYGYYRENDDSKAISEIPCVTFHHVIPHNLINIELFKSRLYIQNSEFESFGLGLIDALQCGCDVLISQYVGAKDIMNLTDNDVINNPLDIDELMSKIKYVIANPNNARLVSTIDKKSTSIEARAKELLQYCKEYLK